MAKYLAKAYIMGRLGHDPETRTLEDGTPVASFSLAVNRQTRAGEVTDWHRITCYRSQAEFASAYLRKGRKVLVEARIENHEWTGRDRQTRRRTEFIATDIVAADTVHGSSGTDRREEEGERPSDIPF